MRFRIINAVCFLILVSPLLPAAQNVMQTPASIEPRVRALYTAAQKAQSRGDYKEAARDYASILKLAPHLPEIRTNLGIMDHLLGRYGEAIQSFREALRENPHLLSANLFLGIDLLEIHRAQRALPYLTEARRLSPQNLQALLSLGRAYADLGKPEEANEYYFQAAAIDPDNESAAYGLGITYLSLQKSAVEALARLGKSSVYGRMLLANSFAHEGRLNDAIQVLESLMKSLPSFPEIHTALGFDEVQRGGFEQAEAEFNDALQTHPGYLPAELGLARVELGKGNKTAARQILQRAWGADPGFVEANAAKLVSSRDANASDQLMGGLEALTEGLPASGLRTFLTAFLANPSGGVTEPRSGAANAWPAAGAPQFHASRGEGAQRLFADGHYTACAGSFDDERKPLALTSLTLLAKCSYYAGRYRAAFLAAGELRRRDQANLGALYWRAKSGKKLALQSLSTLAAAHPDSYRIHLLLGQANLDMNRYKEAESEYAAALKQKPDNLAARIGLATACWKNVQFDSAIPQLKAALAESPSDPGANYIYGDILVERHRYSEARPYLTLAARGVGRRSLMARALLSKVDAFEGKTTEAIAELKQSLSADSDGSLHFQLYQLYKKQGNLRAAQAALAESQTIRARNDRLTPTENQGSR